MVGKKKKSGVRSKNPNKSDVVDFVGNDGHARVFELFRDRVGDLQEAQCCFYGLTGLTSGGVRDDVFDEYRGTDCRVGILSNCRLIREGLNLERDGESRPDTFFQPIPQYVTQSICFMDPTNSATDAEQAVGRAVLMQKRMDTFLSLLSSTPRIWKTH